MNYFQITMKILSALIMVYFFLIMIRVILSWVPSNSEGTRRIRAFLHSLTDPYMKRFQGISWLNFGMFDFSPVLGLLCLSFLLYITQRLSMGSLPSLGEIIIIVIQLVWSLIRFFITLLAILMIIRLISLYAMKGRRGWTSHLDKILFPVTSRLLGVFSSRSLSYALALGLSAVGLLAIRFLVSFLLQRYLFPLLIQL
ncbi:MAG: hypothetical protein B0D92_04400 [Spirochaeta sp. LUC14_002_19_P3]|nr:MAG: hypothetical protein B0D92_04400 [Spirochaeta sp. LUC14_002_19_P3]